MKEINNTKWIPIRLSNLKYYQFIPLYYKNPAGKIVLYKPDGMSFDNEMLDGKFVDDLYIKPEDKVKCLREAQKGFSQELTTNILKHDTKKVKEELVSLIDETLSEPRSGGLDVVPDTVNSIIDGYSKQPDVIKNLARISHTDYTTTIHSINVMALTVGYCFYAGKGILDIKKFGLAALLHDVGKVEIPGEILTANRGLTDEEFDKMKNHPEAGYEILKISGINDAIAVMGCLEHHEKIDGTGYPKKKSEISECGKILGIIDCYEAITNDDRPYRSAMDPMDALSLVKKEVDAGKFDKSIFEDFAYSLTDF